MDQLAEGTLLPPILAGRKALVVGVANVRAMAWVCSKALQRAGAEIAMTYLNGKARPYVEPWAGTRVSVPIDWLPDRGRAITSRTANWPGHLDGFSNRAYAYSAQDLKPRGFLLHAGILDWPGGKPGDVGDRRHSGGGLPLTPFATPVASVQHGDLKWIGPRPPARRGLLAEQTVGRGSSERQHQCSSHGSRQPP